MFIVINQEAEPVGVFRTFLAARTAAEAGPFEEIQEATADDDWKTVWRHHPQYRPPVDEASGRTYGDDMTEVFVVCDEYYLPRFVMRSLAEAREEAENGMRYHQMNFWVKRFILDAPCGLQPDLPRSG